MAAAVSSDDLLRSAREAPRELANRFEHHPPRTAQDAEKHQGVREALQCVADLVVAMVPAGREQSLALTKLEEAMFWANAGIARARGVGDERVPG